VIWPGWKFFTFLAQSAEQLAEPGRASWIPLEGESVPDFKMPAYGQKLLEYLHCHERLAEALAHGEHVELSDGGDAPGTPLFVFPLQTGSRLVALLTVEFPPHLRPSHEALALLRRLCGAAKRLLAALAAEGLDGRVDRSGTQENRAREMEKALAPISYANLQLEALAQVHSHVMRNAVHDLRTPLVAIRGYARLLLREHAGPLTGAQQEYVATMLGNAERMICELNGLSELGESEPVRLTSFDLSRLWPDLVEKIQARAGEKSVRIQERFSRRPFLITADAEMLAQALRDLIRYVIERTADGGLVQVGFDKGDDIAVRIATDDGRRSGGDEPGAGASGEDLEALSAARGAVRRHGGGVSVSGSAGRALTVTVTLPVIQWKQRGEPEDLHEQAFDSCRG